MWCPRAWPSGASGPGGARSPHRMEGLATCLRGAPVPSGGPALWTGVGCGEKEQEGGRAVRGGRTTVAMEGAARYSGIRILTAGDPLGGWLVIGEGDGKPVSLFCPWCFPASLKTASGPPTPPELACLQPVPSVVPSQSCPSASCTKAASGPFPGGLFPNATTAN